MTSKIIASVAFGVVLGIAGTTMLEALSKAPESTPHVDVADFLVRHNGRLFRRYLEEHPNAPTPEFNPPRIEMPDPEMWSWIDHTFLRHDRLFNYWGESVEPIMASTITAGTGTGYYTATCNYYPTSTTAISWAAPYKGNGQ